MNHEEMTDLLHDYARGKLSDEKRIVVERALEKDHGLRAELESVRAYYGDLKSMPEIKAPRDFLSKVRGRIERPGVLGQLRDLLFFPLHIKLPIEITATVALSLLVIIIYNPFAPKVPMPEQFAVRGTPEISSEAPAPGTFENDERVRRTDNLTAQEVVPEKSGKADRRAAPAKKIPAPVRPSGSRAGLTASQTTALASADPSKGAAEKSVMGESRVAAQHSIAEMSKSKAAARPRLSASKPGAFADEQELADGYAGGDTEGKSRTPSAAPIAMSLPSASGALLAEAPASAPSSPYAGLSSEEKQPQPEPLARKKAAEAPQESQIAYNWVPASSFNNQTFEKTAVKTESEQVLQSKRSAAPTAGEKSQASDQVIASNIMKSDNIGYLKTAVANVGGTCTVVNYGGSQYRIKIPAKSFQRFEKEMRSRGDFLSVSGREINLTKMGLKDSFGIIIFIVER